jgi:tetratricopeptide (TPR) repeat protein
MRVTATLFVVLAGLAVCRGAQAHVGLDETSRALDAEVARNPQDAELRLQQARIHLLMHQWRAALAELDAAAKRGADRDVVATTRGRVLLEAGKPRKARAEFDRVLSRRRDAYGTLFDRGRAWLALGDPERAADDFGRAIAGLESPQPEQVIARRDALLLLGRRQDAVRALDEGMERIGRVASLELAAIDLEVELGEPTRALRRIDGLLAAAPQNPAWVALRARLLEQAGRTGEARDEYARALAMIDRRPEERRGRAFETLRRNLQTVLAAATETGNGPEESQ